MKRALAIAGLTIASMVGPLAATSQAATWRSRAVVVPAPHYGVIPGPHYG